MVGFSSAGHQGRYSYFECCSVSTFIVEVCVTDHVPYSVPMCKK